MSPSLIGVILQLVAQLIVEVPSLISDLEKLIGAARGQAPAVPEPPLQPVVDASMAAELEALKTPIAAPSK